ncbi:MAG: hypothetical protein VCC04_01400 [Myxococcota bacterium]
MKSRITRFIFTRLGFALALAVSFTSIAATAQAGIYYDHVLPTLCTSSQLWFIGDNTEFDGTAIGVRPSDSLWDYDIVMCPINRFRPQDDVVLIRILTEGDRATNGWCQLYEAPNRNRRPVDFQYPQPLPGSSRLDQGMVTFRPPSDHARNGMLALTARCLLYPGNSITSIELKWNVR